MRNIQLFENFQSLNAAKLQTIRQFLESKWDGENSTRQCIRTVYFLKHTIGGAIKGGWVSSNPKPNEKGGFLDKNGKWNFHYWLVKNGNIIDLTSDQFGEPAINILPENDTRYYPNADSYNLREDFKFTGFVVDEWIDEYSALYGIS
jgi:peptidoglycan/xylan/chitin deacetylase (PgdA/CDA1 family)